MNTTRTILTIAAGTAIVLLADVAPSNASQAEAREPSAATLQLKETRLAAASLRMRVLSHQRVKRAERRTKRRSADTLN